MAETFTPRLSLIKPARDTNTPLDVLRLNANSDIVDNAIGATHVNAGQTPAAAELYDGKIVREKSTSKVWVAEKQTNGTYLKRWINYPWNCRLTRLSSQGNAVGNQVWTTVHCATFLDNNAVNATEADSFVSPGKIKVPISGLYSVDFGMIWDGEPAATNVNERMIALGIDGTENHSYLEAAQVRVNLGNPGPAFAAAIWQRHHINVTLAPGSELSVMAFQNSLTGSKSIFTAFIQATLVGIRPNAT